MEQPSRFCGVSTDDPGLQGPTWAGPIIDQKSISNKEQKVTYIKGALHGSK